MSNINFVDDLAQLRALELHVKNEISYLGLDDEYRYVPTSVAVDDGDEVICPTNNKVNGVARHPGRWIKRNLGSGGGDDATAYHAGDVLLDPDGDNAQFLGSPGFRLNAVTANRFFVYEAADDENPTVQLSSGHFALGLDSDDNLSFTIDAEGGGVAVIATGMQLRQVDAPDDPTSLANKQYVDDAIDDVTGGADTTAWHNNLDSFGSTKKLGAADNYPLEIYANNKKLLRIYDVCDSGVNPYYSQFRLDRDDNSLVGAININAGTNSYAGFETACSLDYGKVMALLHTGANYANGAAPEVAANEGAVVLGLNSAQMHIRCNGSQAIKFSTNHKTAMTITESGAAGTVTMNGILTVTGQHNANGQIVLNRSANSNQRVTFGSNASSGNAALCTMYLESDADVMEMGVVSSAYAGATFLAGEGFIRASVAGMCVTAKARMRFLVDGNEYLTFHPSGGGTAYKTIVGDVSGRPTLLSDGSGHFLVNATSQLAAEFILLNGGAAGGLGGTRIEGSFGVNIASVAQQTAVADASGGAVQDAEARTALNALLARVRNYGLIAA